MINLAKYAHLSRNEQVEALKEDVIKEARKRYNEGNWDNPYNGDGINSLSLESAMHKLFIVEINKLKYEKVCPCCGQPTQGDLNW